MKPIFFMHIPRCGGTTFERMMEYTSLVRAPRYSWDEVAGMSAHRFQEFEFIAGHYPVAFPKTFMFKGGQKPHKIALIRHPLDRVISHYNYVHEHGYWRDPAYTDFCQNATLEEWLLAPIAVRSASNLMTRFFAGDRRTESLSMALDALDEFDIVYPIEHGMQGFVDEVSELAGLNPLTVGDRKDNPGSAEWTRENISTRVKEFILGLNHKDLMLYEQVVEMRKEKV